MSEIFGKETGFDRSCSLEKAPTNPKKGRVRMMLFLADAVLMLDWPPSTRRYSRKPPHPHHTLVLNILVL